MEKLSAGLGKPAPPALMLVAVCDHSLPGSTVGPSACPVSCPNGHGFVPPDAGSVTSSRVDERSTSYELKDAVCSLGRDLWKPR